MMEPGNTRHRLRSTFANEKMVWLPGNTKLVSQNPRGQSAYLIYEDVEMGDMFLCKAEFSNCTLSNAEAIPRCFGSTIDLLLTASSTSGIFVIVFVSGPAPTDSTIIVWKEEMNSLKYQYAERIPGFPSLAGLMAPDNFVCVPPRWKEPCLFYTHTDMSDVSFLKLSCPGRFVGKAINFLGGTKKETQRHQHYFSAPIVGIVSSINSTPILYVARSNGQVEAWDCSFIWSTLGDKERPTGGSVLYVLQNDDFVSIVSPSAHRMCIGGEGKVLFVYKSHENRYQLSSFNVPCTANDLAEIEQVHTQSSLASPSKHYFVEDLLSISTTNAVLSRFTTPLGTTKLSEGIHNHSSLWLHPRLPFVCFFSTKEELIACSYNCRKHEFTLFSVTSFESVVGTEYINELKAEYKCIEFTGFHALNLSCNLRRGESESGLYPVLMFTVQVGCERTLRLGSLCMFNEFCQRAALSAPILSACSVPITSFRLNAVEDKLLPPPTLIVEHKKNSPCFQLYKYSGVTQECRSMFTIVIRECEEVWPTRVMLCSQHQHFVIRVATNTMLSSFCLVYGSLSVNSEVAGTNYTVRDGHDATLIDTNLPLFESSLVILSSDRKGCTLISLTTRDEKNFLFPSFWVVERVFPLVRSMCDEEAGKKDVTQFLIFYQNSDSGLYFVSKVALFPDNTLKYLEPHIVLSKNEIVFDIVWQNKQVDILPDEDCNSLCVDFILKKKLGAMLTSERVVIFDKNMQLWTSVKISATDLQGTCSVAWLGPVLILFNENHMLVKYMTLAGRVEPLCSLSGLGAPTAALVYRDRLVYGVFGKKQQDGRRTRLLTRPLLPLEPLIVGVLDQFECFEEYLSFATKSQRQYPSTKTGFLSDPPPVPDDLRRLIASFARNFSLSPRDSAVPLDGPSPDAGISSIVLSALCRAGMQDVAINILRPNEMLPLTVSRPQISSPERCRIAMASADLRMALEELLTRESELREYALNPNAGLASVGSMPLRYGQLSHWLRELAVMAEAMGNFEIAAICLDIAGDDHGIFEIGGLLGKHGVPILQALLQALSVTSRDPQLQEAIKAYLKIHGYSSGDKEATSTNRRKRRGGQERTEIEFEPRPLEHFGRRGALLGIGMNKLTLPKWSMAMDMPPSEVASREHTKSMLKTRPTWFGGVMKPLALDSAAEWVGVETPNAAEPPQEQRKFGVEVELKSANGAAQISVLAGITGGADPERAIVAYLRFEDRPQGKEAEDHDRTSDCGPYGNHGQLIGGSTNHISWPDVDSPVDEVSRRQQQYVISFSKNIEEDDVLIPAGAADVVWGLRIDRGNAESMQLDFNQGLKHRNHSLATYEFWVWKDGDEDQVIMGLGYGLSATLEKTSDHPWQWSLTIGKSGLQFRTSGGGELVSPSVSEADNTVPLFVAKRWAHVAVTIDAIRSPSRVCLYLNGKCVRNGEVEAPAGDNYVNTDPTSALFFAPNFDGRLTEIRVWALVRPEDQLYSNRDWPLKMAKKGRKNRLQSIKIIAKSTENSSVSDARTTSAPIAKIGAMKGAKAHSSRRQRKRTVTSK